jgi:hypothetical protein
MYTELARIVHHIHSLLVVYVICGFFVAIIPKFYRFRTIYFSFLMSIVLSQMICSWRCPLVLLEMYLFEMEHPGTVNHTYYKPFIVEFLKSSFNLQVPDIAVTMAILLSLFVVFIVLVGKTVNEREDCQSLSQQHSQ